MKIFRTPWSLQSIVRRNEAEWRLFNRYRKQFALSRLEREMLFAGEHPLRFSISLLILLLAVLVLGYLLPSDWLTAQWTSWEPSEQFAYFSALWAVQATLAALVYPIVIAFVTVFLQRRPASEAFIHLYILDSAALVAGLSSLALVVVMAVQYVLLPIHGMSALPVWVSLDAVWFLLNAVLTTFFLYRTIEFLRPETQQRSIQRYTINVALPRDVARLNAFQVLAQAQSREWIPAPSYLDDKAPDGPKVMLYGLGFREGSAQGTLNLPERSRLYDVRLWTLRIAVLSWLRAASRQPQPKSSGPLLKKDAPLLTIPLTPGREYENPVTLAYVDAGPPLRPWQRLLIRWSLVFQPVRRETYGIKVAAILGELEGDAREAAAKRDVPAFERAYTNLVDLHELLLGASLMVQEDGSVSSWALLPDTSTFFEQELYRGWANTYRSIFQAAINVMPDEARPIQRLCHLAQHLDGQDLQASPVEVRKGLLQLPPLMMYQLGNWWAHRVEEQGNMDHGPHSMASLRPPLHRVYEDVLSSFAAGWESTRDTVTEIPELSEGFEWSSVPTYAQLNAIHIKETARMLLAAVNRGDQAAAEWLADMLSKWWGKYEYQEQPFGLYGKTNFLTIEKLKQDWSALIADLGLSQEDIKWAGSTAALQRGVLLAALQNFWTDIRLLVIEILLSWLAQGLKTHAKKSLALEISAGLLTGNQWRKGGNLSEPLSGLTAKAYLTSKVRQYAADGNWRDGYIGYLDEFVERVKDMQRPDMISSRTYSFSGADDVDSLGESQLILLSVLSDTDWSISDILRRQLDIWMMQQYKSIEILQSRVHSWLERIGKPEPYPPIVPIALTAKMEKMYDYESARQRTQKGLESLEQYMEKARADALEAEQIDDSRLKALSSFASKNGFSGQTGKFPLNLFTQIESASNTLEDFVLTVNQVRKGELTRVEMDQRAVNEEEYWSEIMAQRVRAVVLGDVLSACKMRDLSAPDPSAYWNTLKTEAARIEAAGLKPILILDNATRPEWVWQWQHVVSGDKYQRPEDMRVQKRDGRGPGYLCDFNDIEVYSGPLAAGQSLLMAKETFKSVSFQEFEPGLFVEVTASGRADTKLLLDLKLKFSRRVEVSYPEAVRISYAAGAEPSK